MALVRILKKKFEKLVGNLLKILVDFKIFILWGRHDNLRGTIFTQLQIRSKYWDVKIFKKFGH